MKIFPYKVVGQADRGDHDGFPAWHGDACQERIWWIFRGGQMDFPQRPNVHIILNNYNRVHHTFKYTYIMSLPLQFLATCSNYATRQVRGHGAGVGVRENCHDDLRDLGDSSLHSVFPKHWEGIVIFADHSYSCHKSCIYRFLQIFSSGSTGTFTNGLMNVGRKTRKSRQMSLWNILMRTLKRF